MNKISNDSTLENLNDQVFKTLKELRMLKVQGRVIRVNRMSMVGGSLLQG